MPHCSASKPYRDSVRAGLELGRGFLYLPPFLQMTVVPRFGHLALLTANVALSDVVGRSVGIAFRTFTVDSATGSANPVRVFLAEDEVVVISVTIAIDWTRRIALACLSYVVVCHKKFATPRVVITEWLPPIARSRAHGRPSTLRGTSSPLLMPVCSPCVKFR